MPSIAAVQPVHVATWIEVATRELAAPSVKQRLAALRHLLDWLVNGQVVPVNPAASVIVAGTLPGACYAKGMTGFLSARQIRIFDYPRFAEPLRDRVREGAAELASAAGITIEHITKNHIRKEDVVAGCLSSVATVPAWCISSRRWTPATPTSPGMTSTRIAPSCAGKVSGAWVVKGTSVSVQAVADTGTDQFRPGSASAWNGEMVRTGRRFLAAASG